VWTPQPIEEDLERRLIEEFRKAKGEEIYGLYTTARADLVQNILPQIAAVLPKHTDHGPDHIRHVLQNAWQLLGKTSTELTALDLYSLAMGILFHDVGNLFGRKGHQKRVSKIYSFVRGKRANRREAYIVSKIAEGHCGQDPKGSADTLAYVDETSPLFGLPVSLRDAAAVTRLADELAEGPNRTSDFMLRTHQYDPESLPFHKYANCTEIVIDRASGTIKLTYDLPLRIAGQTKAAIKDDFKELRRMLKFIFQRILKTDQERRYAAHYARHLTVFRNTTAAINFWADEELLEVDLPLIVLNDKVVPGDADKTIENKYKDWKLPNVIATLKKHLEDGK
jgi:hypothetical protein